jgi:protease I
VNQLKVLFLGIVLGLSSVSSASAFPKEEIKVLIPIPSYGFDPTEASVPWKYLKDAQFKVVFATPTGKQGLADVRMLTGADLGIFKFVLMNDENGTKAYRELLKSHEFQHPISYLDIRSQEYDAVFLPGGHDQGMKEYLGSTTIQQTIAEIFDANKPVGAICHGTLVTARSISKKTGRSVLWGRKTTGLTRYQELTAYNMTKSYLGSYYRTYPELDTKEKTVTMEDELKSYLRDPSDFSRGPGFPIPLGRDSPDNFAPGYTFLDGNYLSARWPGDAHKFGNDFVKLLKNYSAHQE